MFFLAVDAADVSRVVPVTAAYPLVTVLAAVLVLSESISIERAVGMLLVVIGVIMLSR
jgi:transporter family protein